MKNNISVALIFLLLIITAAPACRAKYGCPANTQEAMEKPQKHGKAQQGLLPAKAAKKKGLHGR